jgi:predicted dehydrogenase
MTLHIRLAIVGCGAVAEVCHAPALKALRWAPAVLVDPAPARRRSVAAILRVSPIEAARATDVLDSFDAAIVSVPHWLHAPVCVELLRAGKHIFVEKPMAPTVAACAAMNRAAAEGGAKLAVALFRRRFPAGRWLKEAIDSNALGRLRRIVVRDGYDYIWPLTTDFLWRKEEAGGGVLIDTGAHTFDQLIWWFGEPSGLEYADDSDGGVEASCVVRMTWPSGLEGRIELSRTQDLSNTLTLDSDKGRLSIALAGYDVGGSPGMLDFRSEQLGKPPFRRWRLRPPFRAQLMSFAAWVSGEPAELVSGEEAARSVALIERCYAKRRRLERPWISYTGLINV